LALNGKTPTLTRESALILSCTPYPPFPGPASPACRGEPAPEAAYIRDAPAMQGPRLTRRQRQRNPTATGTADSDRDLRQRQRDGDGGDRDRPPGRQRQGSPTATREVALATVRPLAARRSAGTPGFPKKRATLPPTSCHPLPACYSCRPRMSRLPCPPRYRRG